jgi:T-complex protein 1 subunit alpha
MEGTDATLGISGQRTSGAAVRQANVTAALAIANIVKTSLGPLGLDKMLLDNMGEITITNDGATILQLLEVEHPAGKILVELAGLQDAEVGDGTTSVVIIASELLKRAHDLVNQQIHPTSIISGYRLAMREACKYVEQHLAVSAESLGRECLVNTCKTTIASKLLSTDADFWSNMVVDAVLNMKVVNPFTDEVTYPVKSIGILKKQGKGSKESALLNGFGLNCVRASQQMPKKLENVKIALLDYNLKKYRLAFGVQVVVTDPEELEKIRDREAQITKDRIKLIIDSGANVILTAKGIDDYSLKFLVENGIMGVQRVLKSDLRKLAKATGGKLVESLATLEGGEAFDPACLGSAESIEQIRVCDDEMLLISGTPVRKGNTILLRGPNQFYLDEAHRTITDCLLAVRRVLESGSVVPGGASVETALCIYLENFATTLGSREQLAISQFADSLLVIPKTLASNAAKDAVELSAKLRQIHHISQTDDTRKDLKTRGLDLVNGTIRDNQEAGVLEPAMSKIKQLQFATEAAITILRIDDTVKINPEQEQGGGRGRGMPPGMMGM